MGWFELEEGNLLRVEWEGEAHGPREDFQKTNTEDGSQILGLLPLGACRNGNATTCQHENERNEALVLSPLGPRLD